MEIQKVDSNNPGREIPSHYMMLKSAISEIYRVAYLKSLYSPMRAFGCKL